MSCVTATHLPAAAVTARCESVSQKSKSCVRIFPTDKIYANRRLFTPPVRAMKSASRSKGKPRQYGVILTPQLALEIYKCKLVLQSPENCSSGADPSKSLKGQSVPVGNKYNVSAKTIRDIWNRRTWTFATYKLWIEEDSNYRGVFVKSEQLQVQYFDPRI